MAHFRIPGPLDGSRHSLWVDDGTLQRHAGMRPGPVGLGEAGWMDRLDPWGLRQRAEDVLEAVQRAGPRVPAAVARETGEAVDALIEGLLPGLLLMIAVIGVTTAIGGAAGAVVGFLAGGVGAAPGAALGAQAGASAGVWLLTWLGLGFLVVAMADGLGELGGLCMQAARLAWEAREHPDRNSRVDRAADRLADAVALLLKLILMAIVARLTLGQARTAGANLDETITQLRNSRLGAGFADWVAANAARLQRNPKLQPRAQRTGAQAVSEAQTPSQLRRDAVPRGESETRQRTPSQAELLAQRRATAEDFYRSKGLPEERVRAEVEAIDLSRPVDVITVPKGTALVQYQVPGRAQGSYYALPGTPPNQLGISPQGQLRATGEVVEKMANRYVVSSDVQMLRSTAKGVVDTWSIPGASVQTQGGALQFFSPEKSVFLKGP